MLCCCIVVQYWTPDEEIKHVDLTNTVYCTYGAVIEAAFSKPIGALLQRGPLASAGGVYMSVDSLRPNCV